MTKLCPFFDLEFSKCSYSRALAPGCGALVQLYSSLNLSIYHLSAVSIIFSSEATEPIETILCEAFRDWANESLYRWSWSHDQGGCNAHYNGI